MKLLQLINTIFNCILELIFPPRCLVCSEVFPKSDFKAEIHICKRCESKIIPVNTFDNICRKCSRPTEEGNIICPLCQVSKYHFDIAYSYAVYNNSLRRAILSYKFGGQQYKYRDLADLIILKMTEHPFLLHSDIIISVPSSRKRQKSRGFDHVLPIAKYISAKTSIPYIKNAVAKIRETPPQSKLSFNERKLSVKGAYLVAKPSKVCGKTIILIDDILTTGSTVSEIAKILKRAGARQVIVMTVGVTNLKKTGDE